MIRTLITEIPDHTITADDAADTWSCACGLEGGPDLSTNPEDPWTRAQMHQDAVATRLLPLLTDGQVARALQGTAINDSRERAAVDLLVHHGYWLSNGYFRNYLDAGWQAGTLTLRVDWRAVAVGLDQPGRAIQALTRVDVDASLSPELRARMTRLAQDLQQWRLDRDNESFDEASPYEGCPLLRASTSEVAYLRWACSIAGDGLVYLNGDTANLGNAGRGLFLTALAHLLTHGGNLSIGPAAESWPAFAAARRQRDDEPSPLDTVQDLFPVDGPHSAALTGWAGSALTAVIRFLNYATGADRRETGCPYPATAYDVIGSLHRAVAMLDQTLSQSGARLADAAAAPTAYLSRPLGDPRWPDYPTPQATAEAAIAELREARARLQAAERKLSRAHVYAGRIGQVQPDDNAPSSDEW